MTVTVDAKIEMRAPTNARSYRLRWTQRSLMVILRQYREAVQAGGGLHVTNIRLPLHFVLYDLGRMLVFPPEGQRFVLGEVAVREIEAYLAEMGERPFPLPVPYDLQADARELAHIWIRYRYEMDGRGERRHEP